VLTLFVQWKVCWKFTIGVSHFQRLEQTRRALVPNFAPSLTGSPTKNASQISFPPASWAEDHQVEMAVDLLILRQL
jgi:hypothetical protein